MDEQYLPPWYRKYVTAVAKQIPHLSFLTEWNNLSKEAIEEALQYYIYSQQELARTDKLQEKLNKIMAIQLYNNPINPEQGTYNNLLTTIRRIIES